MIDCSRISHLEAGHRPVPTQPQVPPIFLVLGNVAVDEFMAAPAWPAPGATVLVGAPWRDLGGKGANQAIVLRRCGVELRFVATIGADPDGDWIAANLAAEGLAADHLIRLPGSSEPLADLCRPRWRKRHRLDQHLLRCP